MIELVDFSNCKLSPRNLEYGGRAGEKKGITYDNAFWFLKFPKSASGMKDALPAPRLPFCPRYPAQ